MSYFSKVYFNVFFVQEANIYPLIVIKLLHVVELPYVYIMAISIICSTFPVYLKISYFRIFRNELSSVSEKYDI